MRALAAALLLLAPAARAAQRAVVTRREVIIKAPVYGIVVTHDLFRLKAPFDGRIHQVLISSGTWSDMSHPVATIANREYAAMLDSKGREDEESMVSGWKGAFAPVPIRCRDDCFVLKNYARRNTWVKAQAFLAEAAQGLRLVARAQTKDALLIHKGQTLIFWSIADPKRRLSVVLPSVLSDLNDGQSNGGSAYAAPASGLPAVRQGSEPSGGVTFEVELNPSTFLQPGTEWQGEVIVSDHPNALAVPTGAVIRSGTSAYVYLAVPVNVAPPASEGVTEILSGASEGQHVLVIDEPITEAPRQASPRPAAATPRTTPGPAQEPIPEAAPPPREPINDQDLGEDPYGGR